MPYSISDLPSRAGPSLDRARILPLPPLRPLPVKESGDGGDDVDDDENEEGGGQTSSEVKFSLPDAMGRKEVDADVP